MRGWILLLAGCTSWTLDSAQPFAQLPGAPPSLEGRQRLVVMPGEGFSLMTGVDGVEWALLETPNGSDCISILSPPRQIHLVRLGDPALEDEYDGDEMLAQSASMLIVDLDLDDQQNITATHVTPRRPGDGGAHVRFDFAGPFRISGSDNGAALLARPAVELGATPPARVTATLLRSDGSFRRDLALGYLTQTFFAPDGRLLFSFDDDLQLRAHSTRDGGDLALGAWVGNGESFKEPGQALLLSDRNEVVLCDPGGLRALSLSPAAPRLLDSSPCYLSALRPSLRGRLLYSSREEIRSVALDGSSAPRTLYTFVPGPPSEDAPFLWAVDVDRIATSTGTPRYVENTQIPGEIISDGWVEGRQFMERGYDVGFSADGERLYFLEHAAQKDGIGELRSYEIVSGRIDVLAMNVLRWLELEDGRLLAVANAWERADYNRIVVIDVARRTIDWVAAGANYFVLLPASHQVLALLVDDAANRTYVRMPIPERR
jgi:hypothetical protein